MKKILLALSFFLLIGGFANAQNIITTSGSFMNNGQPKSYQVITLYYYSLDSTTTAVLIDSAITDAQGNYSVARDLPIIYSQGYVMAVTTDCYNSFQTKTESFNPTKRNLTINFNCPPINCSNFFYYYADTVFNNNYAVSFVSAKMYGPNITCVWDFGDGNTAQGHRAMHNYAQSGKYNVCLTTTDTVNMCTNVYCDSVWVTNPVFNCYASFSAAANPNSLNVDFTAYSKASTNATLVWNFGDGATATGTSTSHSYPAQGVYNVCLTVIDSANACVSSYCNMVNAGSFIIDSCLAEFKMFMLPDSIQPGASTIYFSLLNYSFTTNAYWNFGDGSTTIAVGQSVVHSYAAQGTYTVTVVTIDTVAQCTDTVTKQIIIDGGVLKVVSLGVEKNTFEINAAYPNPVSDLLNLTINSLETQTLNIQVRDLTGRLLIQSSVYANTGLNKIEIPTAELTNGMYIVEIVSEKGISATKIIKN